MIVTPKDLSLLWHNPQKDASNEVSSLHAGFESNLSH